MAGIRGRKRKLSPALIVAVGAVPLIGLIAAPVWMKHRAAVAAEAAAWAMEGAPCPATDAASYRTLSARPPQPNVFGEVRFERRYGHVSCSLRPDETGGGDYPVCEFNAPALIGVQGAGAAVYFAPPAGQGARVAVQDGRIRCVLVRSRL